MPDFATGASILTLLLSLINMSPFSFSNKAKSFNERELCKADIIFLSSSG